MKMKKSILIGLAVVTMVGCTPQDNTKKEEPVQVTQKQEPEVVAFEVSDADVSLLSKAYGELSEEEVKRLEEIEKGQDDIQDKGTKAEVSDNIARLKEEKVKIEEEERIEAEKKAEEERLEAEKRAEEERIEQERIEEEERLAEEKEKKERYNNTVSWEEIARDKEGKIGSYVRFKGKIMQVMQDDNITQYRFAVDSNYDKVLLIGIQNEKLEQNILEDDIITIEGMSLGNTEYTTVMGAVKTVPLVLVENVYTK